MKLILSLLVAASLFSAEVIVDQKGKTFAPGKIKVNVGDTIKFKNSDSFAHNAYTDDEDNEFDIGMQPPGQEPSIEVKKAGTFNIECAIHPNMILEVTAE